MRLGLIVGFLVCLSGLAVYAAKYDVNRDGTGDFEAIQDAIDAAVDGDEIVVHPGTYYENIHFDGKNITLRSLDPEDEQIVASTVIDGGRRGSVVTFTGTENDTCELSGVTITNGCNEEGGGISGAHYATYTRAAISNSTITDNSGGNVGGGLYGCGGSISNCSITGNSASDSGGGLYRCDAAISNSTIAGNGAGRDGGGLWGCNGTISNCSITGNGAWDGGGLSYCEGTISNCSITGNSAGRDGGGLQECGGTISNCSITGNEASSEGGGLHWCDCPISNCSISGNSADYGGGLAWCHGTISNCTISGNEAGYYGGGVCYATISNCIVWGDVSSYGQCRDAVITYSCVQDGYGGEGNIADDPLFSS